jgi:hypothetical protein
MLTTTTPAGSLDSLIYCNTLKREGEKEREREKQRERERERLPYHCNTL